MLKPNTPNGALILEKDQQTDLAQYIKQCHIDKKDLNDTNKAYQACQANLEQPLQFWQKPEVAIALGVVLLLTGGVVGAQF